MPLDAAFTQQQLDEMAGAASATSERAGLHFTVFVGSSGGGEPSAYAARLLSALGDTAPRGVVILIDPSERRVEIATGHEAARRLDDGACALAASSVASSLKSGDMITGVLTGLRMLGDSVFWRSASQ